jgi:hypothetical protein
MTAYKIFKIKNIIVSICNQRYMVWTVKKKICCRLIVHNHKKD